MMKAAHIKIIFLLALFVFNFSCSIRVDNNPCPNWHYVYTYNNCDCLVDDATCKTYHLISKKTYDCLKTVLEQSSESCIYIDGTTCSGISFSGFIKEVIEDCTDY